MPSGDKQIQDVYHRPNLERARKCRLPLVFLGFILRTNENSKYFIKIRLALKTRNSKK